MWRRESAAKRGYGRRWQKARAIYLGKNPLCVMCEQLGLVTPATVVDHVDPHRGRAEKFWDEGNWQSLCAPCHNQHKQRQENGAGLMGCDDAGLPIDPDHHWK